MTAASPRPTRRRRPPPVLYRLADLAAAAGVSRQAVQQANSRGKLPPPDYVLPDGTGLWADGGAGVRGKKT